MNGSTVADALRFAVTQTVRALTQPGGIQAVATELRQQTTPERPPGTATVFSGAPAAAASAAVELSPAALLSPVDIPNRLAAARGAIATPITVALLEIPVELARTRPGEPGYGAEALRLAAQLKLQAEAPPVATQPLAALLRSVPSQTAMASYASMQPPASRRPDETRPPLRGRHDPDGAPAPPVRSRADAGARAAQPTAKADTSASPVRAAGSPEIANQPAWSPTSTQILRADLAYQQLAPRPDTLARVDIYRFGERDGDCDDDCTQSLGATIRLQMPDLGEVVVTLAISGREIDLAIAAPTRVLGAMRDARDDLESAAGAWGVQLRGLSLVAFDPRPGLA